MSDLLKPNEAMQRLRISRSTLFRLIDEGRLTRVLLGPRLLRLRADEVERLASGVPAVERDENPTIEVERKTLGLPSGEG